MITGPVWPWFVFAMVGVGSLSPFPSHRPSGRSWIHIRTLPEPCQGRDTAGNKIPILRTQELVLGARPRVHSIPEQTPKSPSTGQKQRQ